MPTYTINITLTSAQVTSINAAGQQIIIAKQNPVTAAVPNVAWVTLPPSPSSTVTWEDVYSVYASSTLMQDGVQIGMAKYEALQGPSAWTWNGSSFAPANGEPNYVSVQNTVTTGTQWSLGLAQAYSTGGDSPLTPFGYASNTNGQTSDFIPIETVFVYLAAAQPCGSVISKIPGNPTQIEMTTFSLVANLTLNSSNEFVQGES